MIFLGAGDISKEAVQGLHDRLDEAIGILGGIQQPLMSTDGIDREVEEHEVRALRGELQDAIADICVALGDPPIRYLTIPGRVEDPDLEKFKEKWHKLLGISGGAWKTPIIKEDK